MDVGQVMRILPSEESTNIFLGQVIPNVQFRKVVDLGFAFKNSDGIVVELTPELHETVCIRHIELSNFRLIEDVHGLHMSA